ncbi:MAG: BamA/TamA family outer membrane protein [Hymenobacteraceae bacterium]|nr:BamA/TamA family outer membrane protein [Hymenobacteraceae bacterium]
MRRNRGIRARAMAFRRWLVLAVAVLLTTVGCTPTSFLKPKENLLYRAELKGVHAVEPAALEALYQQKPHTTLPLLGGTPKLWFWVQGRRTYRPEKIDARLQKIEKKYDDRIRAAQGDSLKVVDLFEKRERRRKDLVLRKEKGNFLMRKLGEVPVIHDSAKTAKTVDQMAIYLAGKGFFRGRVSAATTVRDRKATVVYSVTEGPESVLAILADSIADPVVATLVRADRDALKSQQEDGRLLREGGRYNADLLSQERTRLDALLKNHGYFDFQPQYISFLADTTKPTQVRLTTIIANPADAVHHPVYHVERVQVVADADRTRFGLRRDTVAYGNVQYLAYQHRIRPWALDRKLSVRPGDLYSPDAANLTQRQLSDLDLFRFVSVNFSKAPVPVDSARRDSLVARGVPQRGLYAVVALTPQKKYQETTEAGVTVFQNLPGPFGSVRLRVRNVFKGGELLDIGLRGGLDGQFPFSIRDNRAILATQLGGNLTLSFPRVLVAPPGFDRRMAAYNPRTRLTAAYTYTNRDEYRRSNLELTYDYIWQRSPALQYVVTPFDISLINAKLNPEFEKVLDDYAAVGFPLKRSFQDQLVPSINFQRIFNSNDFAQTRDAKYSRLFLEIGGLTNLLVGYDRALLPLTKPDTLPVFSFVKVALDLRRYWKLAPEHFIVGRFNGGLARSLQSASNGGLQLGTRNIGVLPYDKYFFAGGPSSVRAWRPRRLGPGAYHQPDVVTKKADGSETRRAEALEQPGELLLEANLEYRAPIYGFLKGAVFVDAGNIWTLSDDARPGAKFAPKDFWREIALGTGLGLRFDFSFLVLRLDAAVRVYDPTVPDGESRYVLPKFQRAFNLGIGYPF